MANVLLIDPDWKHAFKIACALRLVSPRIILHADVQDAAETLRAEQIDLVISIPDIDRDWKREVETLQEETSKMLNPPQILCVLRSPYRGPEDRLYGAQRGIQVIHEN